MALLSVCQALRTAVSDAVQSVPGTGPDRASYQVAIETAQNLVITAQNITSPGGDLICHGDIGRAVLASLHAPGGPASAPARSSPRFSRWNRHPDGKPRANYRTTSITVHVDASYHQPATRRRKPVTTDSGGP